MSAINALAFSLLLASLPSTGTIESHSGQTIAGLSGVDLEDRIIIPNREARTANLEKFGIKVLRPCGEYFLQVRVPDIPFNMLSYVSGYLQGDKFIGARAAVSLNRAVVIIDNKKDSPRVTIVLRGKDEPPDNIFKLSQKDFDAAKACLPKPRAAPQ